MKARVPVSSASGSGVGAAAAALWATLRAVPLADRLAASRQAALRIAEGDGYELVVPPELDIVCPFARRGRASEITEATQRAFDSLAEDPVPSAADIGDGDGYVVEHGQGFLAALCRTIAGLTEFEAGNAEGAGER